MAFASPPPSLSPLLALFPRDTVGTTTTTTTTTTTPTTTPTSNALALEFAATAISHDPRILRAASKADLAAWAACLATLLASKAPASVFSACVLIRLSACHAPPAVFAAHAAAWCNGLLLVAKRTEPSVLLDEIILTWRSLIVRTRPYAILQRDVANPNVQKMFTMLLQKIASFPSSKEYKAHVLLEYSILGTVFPTIAKTFADKIELLCISALSSSRPSSCRLMSSAVKALVVVNRIINAPKKLNPNDSSKTSLKPPEPTIGKISNSLMAIVREVVGGVKLPPKSQPYTFLDQEVDKVSGPNVTLTLNRFKALVNAHIFLLSSKGERNDILDIALILEIADLVFNSATRNSSSDSKFTNSFELVRSAMVFHINKLLGALINAVNSALLPNIEILWNLARQSFACSHDSETLRISSYCLLTTFVEVFGANGGDYVYQALIEDAISDMAGFTANPKVKIAATKYLLALLTYTPSTQIPASSLAAIFNVAVRDTMDPPSAAPVGTATASAIDADAELAAVAAAGAVPAALAPTLAAAHIRALHGLLVACMASHARDAFPAEWVVLAMRALARAAAVGRRSAGACDLAARAAARSAAGLLSVHGDVLFGYRPQLRLTTSASKMGVVPDAAPDSVAVDFAVAMRGLRARPADMEDVRIQDVVDSKEPEAENKASNRQNEQETAAAQYEVPVAPPPLKPVIDESFFEGTHDREVVLQEPPVPLKTDERERKTAAAPKPIQVDPPAKDQPAEDSMDAELPEIIIDDEEEDEDDDDENQEVDE
ncbi:hypothetical protein HDU84_007803 [Entophlyctis sp. JEL0112]|nr:hypothetical protein HDU84_007803 [Entophlyctis sp. JEL0112]